MKKITFFMSLFMGLLLFTSCEKDDDSNPTLQEPTTFVLNTPALAGSIYDLANSEGIRLTCSQPDYGYTAATTYKVQVALNEADFAEEGKFETLASTYQTASMLVAKDELAASITTLLLNAGRVEADFPLTTPVYIRLQASLNESTGIINSNVVKLNSVRTAFALPPVTLPTHIYMIGSYCDWSWDKSLELVPVNSTEDMFWHLAYLDGDNGIKFNAEQAWDGKQVGYNELKSVNDNAGAGLAANGDGNIIAGNAGWYLLVVSVSIEGRDIRYELTVESPNVYLTGGVTPLGLDPDGAGWAELQPGTQFTVPTTKDGEFISPAFSNNSTADGVRAYVKIAGHDWWHSEFIVGLNGNKISYRGKGGDQTRVQGMAGQKMYLNFGNDTGRIE